MRNYELNPPKSFFVGLNTGFVDEEFNPNNRCIDFYSSRSGHGLHCAIVGNVVLPNGFGTNAKTARISSAPVWGQLAKAIADRGALPGIQLSSTWPDFRGERRFITREPGNAFDFYRRAGTAISPSTIETLMDELLNASKMALDHGFRHVQIHAAHGYLFNLALHPMFSSYSESTLDKVQGWIDKMRKCEIETSVRISITTGWQNIDDEYTRGLTPILGLKADYFDISDGLYNIDKQKIYPSTKELSNRRFAISTGLATKWPGKQFILSGQAKHHSRILPSNLHLGYCRDLIANPDFLLEMKSGCVLCNKCHYFSRGEDSLVCPQWANHN